MSSDEKFYEEVSRSIAQNEMKADRIEKAMERATKQALKGVTPQPIRMEEKAVGNDQADRIPMEIQDLYNRVAELNFLLSGLRDRMEERLEGVLYPSTEPTHGEMIELGTSGGSPLSHRIWEVANQALESRDRINGLHRILDRLEL